MNKKAQEEWVYGIPAMVFLVVIITIFLIFFVLPQSIFNKTPAKVEKEIYAVQNDLANIILINYLKTHLEVNGNKITISDLIALAYADEKYKQVLKKETEEILNALRSKQNQGWNLIITSSDNKNIRIITYSPHVTPDSYTSPGSAGLTLISEAETTIPLYEKGKYAIVNIHEVAA